ncbi:peptidyl-prolyl cis-trans isomerase [Lutibacter sp. A64]|uniref:peptidyl-prolyl cis-trans isomerase n=1 Tax=Lutibacter sp. A64 TaxID=2918526 RepID=UPI001F05910A|nr:peptidyl-prolyl cis-trans isomerase [Lutibacter sp. A64]UMB54392.1 peptidyl-prolyl cis-trans isomerase [Lutibacter sp. A64]
MKQLAVYICLFFMLLSCNYFTIKDDTREAVARVNDTYLYKKDLKNVVSAGVSKTDSILLVNNFINNWIKQQLLLEKAQINLENKTEEFDVLVKTYREDLFINSYKEAVVKQYLDTTITENDIQEFYSKNNQNFKLNEELLKLKYIKIGKDIYNKESVIKLFKSSKKSDLDSLHSVEMALKSHHLNDSVWVKYTDLILKVPILKNEDKNQLLKKDNFIEKEDSLSLYLVAIKDVLKRNEIAPTSYITPTIKQMILHQRKLLLLRNIEETLIDDARKKQQFETY